MTVRALADKTNYLLTSITITLNWYLAGTLDTLNLYPMKSLNLSEWHT